MPLARFSLYESGVEIYLASTADDGDAWQATLVHIARESRAFVVAPCHFQRVCAYPDDFPLRDLLDGHEIIGRGGSAILAPTAPTSRARCTTRRASSTRSSSRPGSGRSASGSTRRATTTGPTSSASSSGRSAPAQNALVADPAREPVGVEPLEQELRGAAARAEQVAQPRERDPPARSHSSTSACRACA